jgi:hypothetical protein
VSSPAILILGRGAVGKSSAARYLAKRLELQGCGPVTVVDFDEMRLRLAPIGIDPHSPSVAVKQEIYRRAAGEFRKLRELGRPLIIDCGLTSERIRLYLKTELPGLKIVHLFCPVWLSIWRDTARSLAGAPHARGHFLYLHALADLALRRRNPFPQPGITYEFQYPHCADAHINTYRRAPAQVAEEIQVLLKISCEPTD